MFMQERAKMLSLLWHDEGGSVLTSEVVLLATILVLGIVVGAKSFRDAAVTEWADYAQAIGRLDQSYNIPDVHGTDGTTIVVKGGHFLDFADVGDNTSVPVGVGDPLAYPGTDIFWHLPTEPEGP